MQMDTKLIFAVNVTWKDNDLSPEEEVGKQIEDQLNKMVTDATADISVEGVYLVGHFGEFDRALTNEVTPLATHAV